MKKNAFLPETLSDAELDSICLSVDHSYGLHLPDNIRAEMPFVSGFTEQEKKDFQFLVKEMYSAIRKEFVIPENHQNKNKRTKESKLNF